jgi:hypothetical protein
MGSLFKETCGIFSLQGLVEPISLMSATANSGDIIQRGIAACPEAAGIYLTWQNISVSSLRTSRPFAK